MTTEKSSEIFKIFDEEKKQLRTWPKDSIFSSEEVRKESLEIIYKNFFLKLRREFDLPDETIGISDDSIEEEKREALLLLDSIKESFEKYNFDIEGEKEYIKKNIELMNKIFDSVFIYSEPGKTILNNQFVYSLQELCYVSNNDDNFRIKEKFDAYLKTLLIIIELERSRLFQCSFSEYVIESENLLEDIFSFEICEIFRIFPSSFIEDLPESSVKKELTTEEYKRWKDVHSACELLKHLNFSINKDGSEFTTYWESFCYFLHSSLSSSIVASERIKKSIICWIKIYVEKMKNFTIRDFKRWGFLNNDGDQKNELAESLSGIINELQIEEKFEKFLKNDFQFYHDWFHVKKISEDICRITENIANVGNLYAIVFCLRTKLEETKLLKLLREKLEKDTTTKLSEQEKKRLAKSTLSLSSGNPYFSTTNSKLVNRAILNRKILEKKIFKILELSEKLFELFILGESEILDNLKKIWANLLRENSWEKIDKKIQECDKTNDLNFATLFIDIHNCLQLISDNYEEEGLKGLLSNYTFAFSSELQEKEKKEQSKHISQLLQGLVSYANELIKNEFWRGLPPSIKQNVDSVLEKSSAKEKEEGTLEKEEEKRVRKEEERNLDTDDQLEKTSLNDSQKGPDKNKETNNEEKLKEHSSYNVNEKIEETQKQQPEIAPENSEDPKKEKTKVKTNEEKLNDSKEHKKFIEEQISNKVTTSSKLDDFEGRKDGKKIEKKDDWLQQKTAKIANEKFTTKETKKRGGNNNFFIVLTFLLIVWAVLIIYAVILIRIKADIILQKLVKIMAKRSKEDFKKSTDKKVI